MARLIHNAAFLVARRLVVSAALSVTGRSGMALGQSLMLLWIGCRGGVTTSTRSFFCCSRNVPAPTTRFLGSTTRPLTSISSSGSNHHGNTYNKVDVISSSQSKTIKTLVNLLTKRKKRYGMGETVVEGPKMVLDLINNAQTRHLVQQVVVSEAKWDAYSSLLFDAIASDERDGDDDNKRSSGFDASTPRCLPFQLIRATPEVLDSCTDTVTNQGIVARVRIPSMRMDGQTRSNDDDDEKRNSFYLVLDGLQDPGNVGTLVRSCVATGAAGVLVLPPSADLWSPKALRSSMGAAFLLPIQNVASWDECLTTLRNVGCHQLYAATMLEASSSTEHGGSSAVPASVPHSQVDWTRAPVALVIGGEGSGLSDEVRRALGQQPDLVRAVHVPMLAGVESLNAGVCGSVILFEYLRQAQRAASAEAPGPAIDPPNSRGGHATL